MFATVPPTTEPLPTTTTMHPDVSLYVMKAAAARADALNDPVVAFLVGVLVLLLALIFWMRVVR